MSPRHFQIYQLAAGACDSTTGLLLLIAPAFTLRLMGIHAPASEPVLLSFIGAFVAGMGATYLTSAIRLLSSEDLAAAAATWRATGIIRFCVGAFVCFAVARKQLEPAWLTVSVVDLLLAAFQLWGVTKGILRHD